MSDQDHGEEFEAQGPPDDAPGAEADMQAETEDVGALQRALEAERGEATRQREQALRAAAEVENVRRRTQREVESARKFGQEKFASDLLPVVDSLEKSVDAVRAHPSEDDAFKAIREGIELSLKLFMDTLEKSGIEQVNPAGERFDPDFHEAMVMVDSPEAAPNTVVEVVQKGYTLNGRVLRPAMVTVAKAESGG